MCGLDTTLVGLKQQPVPERIYHISFCHFFYSYSLTEDLVVCCFFPAPAGSLVFVLGLVYRMLPGALTAVCVFVELYHLAQGRALWIWLGLWLQVRFSLLK